jgi:hypothetical protein
MSLRAELVRLGLRWFVKRKIGRATTHEALRRQDAFRERLVPSPPKGTQATQVDLDGVKAVAVVAAPASSPHQSRVDCKGRGQTDASQTTGTACSSQAAAEPSCAAYCGGQRIGVVTHYYSHLSVVAMQLEPDTTLRVGDIIHIRGHTSDFAQNVDSLEVNHAPVTEVGPNDDFGLKVVEHAREHDIVYKVRS